LEEAVKAGTAAAGATKRETHAAPGCEIALAQQLLGILAGLLRKIHNQTLHGLEGARGDMPSSAASPRRRPASCCSISAGGNSSRVSSRSTAPAQHVSVNAGRKPHSLWRMKIAHFLASVCHSRL